jgi:nitrilase
LGPKRCLAAGEFVISVVINPRAAGKKLLGGVQQMANGSSAKSTSQVVRPYIAACVQAAPVSFDLERTLEKTRDLARDARKTGAELILFPEAFVSAYPRGSSFGATIGSRSGEGRELFRQYHASSIDVPGPAVERLGKVAKENGTYLVIGVIEREGGTLYCTVLTFGPQGVLLGKHRKLMPTGSERLVWGFGDGSTLPVYHTELGRLGAVICWENYMPMLRAAMYAQQIQIYCAPTADGRPTWAPSMQHIALEGRCFVLSSNQFCKRSDYPDTYTSDLPQDPDTIVSRGGSCIIDPLGTILAGPIWDKESIIHASIDLNEVTRALYDFDPVGHYSRPDVFSLSVDQREKRAVNPLVAGLG